MGYWGKAYATYGQDRPICIEMKALDGLRGNNDVRYTGCAIMGAAASRLHNLVTAACLAHVFISRHGGDMPLHHLCEPVELAPGISVWAERVVHGPKSTRLDRFPHYHGVGELVVFDEAAGSFWLDGEEARLDPPCLVYVPPMCHHDYNLEPGQKSWTLIQIDPAIIADLAHTLPEIDLTHPFVGAPDRIQMEHIRSLCSLLLQISQATPQASIVIKTIELILWLAAATRSTSPTSKAGPKRIALPVDRFRPALEALQADPAHDWSLEDMASRCHMSAPYFSRRFSEIMGMNLTAYIRVYRLQLAARRLVQGREAIGLIAHDAGFSSPAHFAFQFKQRFGLTPRAYRQAGQTRSPNPASRTRA